MLFCETEISFKRKFVLMEFWIKNDDVAGRHGTARCDSITFGKTPTQITSNKVAKIISKDFYGGIILPPLDI